MNTYDSSTEEEQETRYISKWKSWPFPLNKTYERRKRECSVQFQDDDEKIVWKLQKWQYLFFYLQTKMVNLGNIFNKLQHWGTNTTLEDVVFFVYNLSIIYFFVFFRLWQKLTRLSTIQSFGFGGNWRIQFGSS